MMARRLAVATLLVVTALLVAATDSAALLLVGGALGVSGRLLFVSRRGRWRSVVPIAVFAALLAALELVSGGHLTRLPAKAIAIFLLVTAAARACPPVEAFRLARPGSRLWTPLLFVLVTRHFVRILLEETARVLQAWALATPRRRGPGALRALAWALVSIGSRCFARAERFYAAQQLRGLSG